VETKTQEQFIIDTKISTKCKPEDHNQKPQDLAAYGAQVNSRTEMQPSQENDTNNSATAIIVCNCQIPQLHNTKNTA